MKDKSSVLKNSKNLSRYSTLQEREYNFPLSKSTVWTVGKTVITVENPDKHYFSQVISQVQQAINYVDSLHPSVIFSLHP